GRGLLARYAVLFGATDWRHGRRPCRPRRGLGAAARRHRHGVCRPVARRRQPRTYECRPSGERRSRRWARRAAGPVADRDRTRSGRSGCPPPLDLTSQPSQDRYTSVEMFAPEYVACVLNENFDDAKELFYVPLMAVHYAHLA